MTSSNPPDPAMELLDGRAVIDWDLGGVIVTADGHHIGHVDDLSDELLEQAFLPAIGRADDGQ